MKKHSSLQTGLLRKAQSIYQKIERFVVKHQDVIIAIADLTIRAIIIYYEGWL